MKHLNAFLLVCGLVKPSNDIDHCQHVNKANIYMIKEEEQSIE